VLSSAVVAVGVAGAADQAKNLQVLPKTIPMTELKARMKAQAKELGVQCDHCHDTDDFAKDTDTKKIGRGMMTMAIELNKKHFQGRDVITCATCHNGHEFPPMGGADLAKDKAKDKEKK
jgi:thioredoxin reductase